MARKRYKVNILSKSSVEKLKQDLLKYKQDLDNKVVIFCEKLADCDSNTLQKGATIELQGWEHVFWYIILL